MKRTLSEFPRLEDNELLNEIEGGVNELMADVDELRRALIELRDGKRTAESILNDEIVTLDLRFALLTLLMNEALRRGWGAPAIQIRDGISDGWDILREMEVGIHYVGTKKSDGLAQIVEKLLRESWSKLKNTCANKIKAKIDTLKRSVSAKGTLSEEEKRVLKKLIEGMLKSF